MEKLMKYKYYVISCVVILVIIIGLTNKGITIESNETATMYLNPITRVVTVKADIGNGKMTDKYKCYSYSNRVDSRVYHYLGITIVYDKVINQYSRN